MRTKSKKINRDGWMCRIQKWALDIDAEKTYMGYCPFFWVTLLCVLLSPVILAIKIVYLIGDVASKFIGCFIKDANENELEVEYKEPEIDPEEWAKQQKEVIRKEEERERSQEKYDKIKQEYIDKACAVLRVVMKPAVVVGCIVASYWVYKLLFWFVASSAWWWTLIGLGVIVAVAASAFALFLVCKIIANLIFNSVKKKNFEKPFPGQRKVLTPLVKFADLVAGAVGFVVETFKMTYEKECPLIEWGEESGKIEKIKK